MSLGPILPGRLPNSLASTRLRTSLAQINRALTQLQDQAATGQRLFLPSDNPGAALRSIALQRTLERQDHFQSAIQIQRVTLSATDTALATVGDAANRAKAIALAGVGTTSTPAEKQALADEVGSLIQSVLNAGNTQQNGRYLFGGSATRSAPFESVGQGVVRYNGDDASLQAFVGTDLLVAGNVDGQTAFGALSAPVTADVNPALTFATRVRDLLDGRGVPLGPITVTVDDGVNPATTATVDLAGAESIGDIRTRLEVAFPPGALTVDIDPATRSGLRLSAAGSVAVQDLAGSYVAQRLGIAGGPAATIVGGDLNPRLTPQSNLADLNGGLGLQNAANGLRIVNGEKSAVVNVSTATTVEDLVTILEQSGLDLSVRINDAGNGIAISSRLSGATLTIGEDGGTTAANLGIRTLTGQMLLADLNRGLGVPNDGTTTLDIQLANGTQHQVDLSQARTVQDVIDAINGVGDPNLTASLNAVGNGITLTDTSIGANGFVIAENSVSTALGIAGSLPGSGSIVGADVNPQGPSGILDLLLRLQNALHAGDDRELSQLATQFSAETDRLNLVRGDVGGRLSLLDDVEGRIEDQNVVLNEALSKEFDADLTEVITQLAQVTATLQATLQIAASTQKLSLFDYL